jgi:hypothetical protein
VFHNFLSHECMRNLGEKPMFSPVENEVGGSTEKPEKTPEKPEFCPSNQTFEKLSAWAKDAKEKDADSYNLTNFGLDFKNLIDKEDSGVIKQKTAKALGYNIKWDTLKECLERLGLFNNNV